MQGVPSMTTDPAGRVDIADRLWSSDVASALTNEAAREIERLRAALKTIASVKYGLEISDSDEVMLEHFSRRAAEYQAIARAALAPAEGEKE